MFMKFLVYAGDNEESVRTQPQNKGFLYKGKFCGVREYHNLKSIHQCRTFAILIQLIHHH